MSARVESVRRALAAENVDALILTGQPDIRWATGFTGSNAVLVVTADDVHLVTDGRYGAQAAAQTRGVQVHVPGYDLIGHVAGLNLFAGDATVLVPAETTTIGRFRELEDRLGGVRVMAGDNPLVALRARKEAAEIDAVRAAQRLTERVFDQVLPTIAAGIAESDVAAEIVYHHLKGGASAMAFEPIVASGARSALPHARATSRRIEVGDVVLIDMGCYLDGYASDMTRTVVVGEPDGGVQRVYAAVLEAQEAAIAVIRAGVAAREVDAVARGVLAQHDLADFFVHSLGHGVGLEVHEAPRMAQRSDEVLPVGAVITVEPGVYLPDRYGIRIEDIVVVREDGAEVITSTPKALLSL